VILRGGSESARSNAALGQVIAAGLEDAGLPGAACQVVASTERALVEELLKREDEIDLCIPRGGEGLIRFVAERARMPVIKHYKGVCHVFVDERADLDMALAISENAKVSRPGVCNACETILVHEAIAPAFIPGWRRASPSWAWRSAATSAPASWGRAHRGRRRRATGPRSTSPSSWPCAWCHARRRDRPHREVRLEPHRGDRDRRLPGGASLRRRLHSSTVVVNASTRFGDGGELGLGAEIGISTTKIHAYGPMGARELTTTKFVVLGNGQVRT
jgi:glutamate-5-semialdehyde dehydrogenase